MFTKLISLFKKKESESPFYKFSFKDINGNEFHCSSLKNKNVLIVNTASACGLTPQFKQLELLYQKHKHNNFEIVAFPSNDFGDQEPLSNQEIINFCKNEYPSTFPIMEKTKVLGEKKHPLFKWIESHEDSKFVPEWNFHKFFIDKQGELIKEFEPGTSPLDKTITELL